MMTSPRVGGSSRPQNDAWPVAAAPPAAAAPLSRMSLGAVTRGRLIEPLRILIFGTEGVGKSTFGASAPAPIFLCTEDGTAHLDVARFPAPGSLADIFDAIRALVNERHDYQTLVIDTLDSLEPTIYRAVCDRSNKKSISDFSHGAGYIAAIDEWRKILAEIERLRRARGMNIVMCAHAIIKSFPNPEGDSFDRYQVNLNEKAAGLTKAWSDCVFFAQFEALTYVDERTKKVKGVTGARVIRTVRAAAYDAKNRFDLPDPMPLSWDDFAAAVARYRAPDPAIVRAEIAAIVEAVPAGALDRVKFDAVLAAAGDDGNALANVRRALETKIANVTRDRAAASAASQAAAPAAAASETPKPEASNVATGA